MFLPVSELNRLRQQAVARLSEGHARGEQERLSERGARIRAAVADVPVRRPDPAGDPVGFSLSAEVFRIEDAATALAAGASEVVLDPFLRHPLPPVSRARALATEARERGAALRLRTPTIVRPEDRRALDKWLALDLPILTGHAGLACELAASGRDVAADYAVNCFNPHTAAELFARGVRRIAASVELTVDELRALVAPWSGAGFEVLVYGRPEGMTLEHCVLSAAFDRQPTTCRDLCVQKHTAVSLTDPAGYTFPLATDSDCRNRLLHSRPVEASEFLPRLWAMGIRSYRCLFNVAGDPVGELVSGYRATLDALAHRADRPAAVPGRSPREIVGPAFTRGHYSRAV
jgi:putative protease